MRRQNASPSLPVVEEARPVDAVEQLDIESVGETPAEADGGESAEERMALYARVARQAREEGMREAYPDFDPDDALDDPVLGPLLRGIVQPSLRQLYEAARFERLAARRVEDAVNGALTRATEEAAEAVRAAVSEGEERLLAGIRARGKRPAENGLRGATGIRLRPAVERLTRRERAQLAHRAQLGETVEL